jgi:hypothetical protein
MMGPQAWRWFVGIMGALCLALAWAVPREPRWIMVVLFWVGFFGFFGALIGRW